MSKTSLLPSVGKLFSDSWKQYNDRFQLFFMISLVASVALLVMQIVQLYLDDSAWAIALTIVMAIISIYISVWVQGAMTLAAHSTEQRDWQGFFSKSQTKVGVLFWASVLSGLAVLGGFILVIVPGVIFALWFVFAGFFIMYENKGAIDSMKASKALVKGNLGGLFGRFLVVGIVYIAIAIISSVVSSFTSPILYAVISALITALITPFFLLCTYNLYTALKSRAA